MAQRCWRRVDSTSVLPRRIRAENPLPEAPMGGMTMAHIERRQIQLRTPSGRVKLVTRYRVRYRDRNGAKHCETKNRLIDAERRMAEIDLELATDRWRDPRRGDIRLEDWAEQWLLTRHDLRAITFNRLKLTMAKQVLPR